ALLSSRKNRRIRRRALQKTPKKWCKKTAKGRVRLLPNPIVGSPGGSPFHLQETLKERKSSYQVRMTRETNWLFVELDYPNKRLAKIGIV
ncbi:MAG: hypothetical protein ACK4I8_11210, partial [Armatimonadota bacterium]